jgi:hypothetical protein
MFSKVTFTRYIDVHVYDVHVYGTECWVCVCVVPLSSIKKLDLMEETSH